MSKLSPRYEITHSKLARVFGMVVLFGTSPVSAFNWDGIKGKDVVLFYPGQASWEWVLTPDDHSGARKFKEGKTCVHCHAGEQKDIGELTVSGKKLEPKPIPGKPGSLVVHVKAAHDRDNLYLRLEWAGAKAASGQVMDADYATKVALMFDDGHVPEATRAGCFSVCHDDAATMASAPPASKMTKYLPASRTKIQRTGGGENHKAQPEIDQLLKDGVFMEYWQAKLNKAKPPVAADGYILAMRRENPTAIVKTEAQFQQGRWVVILNRKLTPNMAAHKNIVPGKSYTMGFAIHDDYTAQRFHYVSFPHTLMLDGGNADIVAREIKP